MILHKLIVKKTTNNEIIREIPFNHSGLSVIMDDSEVIVESGSNIGKSTAVKIIDVCLGAKSASSIYKDSDTGSNVIVEKFIKDNKVMAELILKDSSDVYHSLKRDLFPNGKKSINDESKTEDEYWQELKKIIFNIPVEEKKPSFRQLISKFVRLDANNEETILKFLGTNTKGYEYYIIYQYLFGINRLSGNQIEIRKKISNLESEMKVILNKNGVETINELQIKISLIQEVIDEQKEQIHLSKTIKDEFSESEHLIESVFSRLQKLEVEISRQKFSMQLYQERLDSEQRKVSDIDTNILKTLFDEAQSKIGLLFVEFDEYVKFHNQMVKKRIMTLNKMYEDVKKSLNSNLGELEKSREEYNKLIISYKTFVNNKLEQTFEQYYKDKEVLAKYNGDYEYIELKKIEYDQLQSKLSNDNDTDTKAKIIDYYNERLKYYTKNIIGDPSKIDFSDNSDGFPIKITGAFGKPGTGTKKSMITCLDLSLVDTGLKFFLNIPHFVIHDKLENISVAELKGIVELTKTFKGQYIFPVLKDRITNVDIKEKDIVLKLSTKSKFFKI